MNTQKNSRKTCTALFLVDAFLEKKEFFPKNVFFTKGSLVQFFDDLRKNG